jgi:signal transduction histidine kinase
VISNLLANAVRFAPPGGVVRSSLALARRLGCAVFTADAAWIAVDVGADVRLVR